MTDADVIDQERTWRIGAPRHVRGCPSADDMDVRNRLVEVEVKIRPAFKLRSVRSGERRLNRTHVIRCAVPRFRTHVRIDLHADPVPDIGAVDVLRLRGAVCTIALAVLKDDGRPVAHACIRVRQRAACTASLHHACANGSM